MIVIDLATFTVIDTGFVAQTEELWSMRVFDGVLYLPHMDLRGFNSPAIPTYDTYDGSAFTEVLTDPVLTHCMELAVTDDGIFLFGSIEVGGDVLGNAVILHSTDDGASFTQVVTTGTGAFDRFYTACWFDDGTILAFASIADTGVEAWQWPPGGPWEQLGDPATVGATDQVTGNPTPFTVDGTQFWLCTANGSKDAVKVLGAPPLIVSLPADAAAAAALLADCPVVGVYDAAFDTGVLYVLGTVVLLGAPHLVSCDDAGTWTDHGAVDLTARSIAVDSSHSRLLLGTNDSWVVPIAIPV